MAHIVSRGWTRHPNHLPRVDARFGSNVTAWLPGISPVDTAGTSPLTYSTRAAFNAGFRGPQVQFTGAQFTSAVTIPTITGASSESWLCVLGSTISTANSARLLNAAGDGMSCSTASLIVRASSTNVITSTNAPVAGDAFFFQIKNADYRLYHKGAKQTSTSTLGNEFISSAMQQTNDSIALLARWTNEIPDDELIWELLGNPWALFEPRRVFVPVAASSGVTASLTATDEDDALSSSAVVDVAASLTATDAADTLSASASVEINASASLTDADDTLSSEATVTSPGVSASLTAADEDDALSAAGSVSVDAAASLIDADDTLESTVTATADISASLDLADADDELLASAEVTGDAVVSLGGRIDYPLLPDKRIAKLWRMDDDDTLQASATVAKIQAPQIIVSSLLSDEGDAISSKAIVVMPLRLIRATQKASLRRATQ